MDADLEKIKQFHGHLGPYAVLGYKMGKIACEKLGSDPFEKTVKIATGTTPPISCIIDGVQLGSGCTLGKGNIIVTSEKIPRAIFTNKRGETLTIRVQKQIQQEIDENVTNDNIISYSKDIYSRMNEELFEIE